MANTLKKVLTAIADTIRLRAGELDPMQPEITRKYKLSEMPNAIDSLCFDQRYAGYIEGMDSGYQSGYGEGAGTMYSQISQKLDTTVQIATDNGAEGNAGNTADSKIEFLNTNIPKIEKAGYSRGLTSAAIATQIAAEAVNSYLDEPKDFGTTHAQHANFIKNNVPQVYENGRDDWWLKFQQEKEAYGYRNAFWGGSWTDETYQPIIDIVADSGSRSHNEMFRGTAITNIRVSVDFKQSGTTYAFSSPYIEKIPLLKVVETVTYANWFTNCTALTEITMSGVIANDINFQYSPLNKASIESVMGCLSTTASGKTLTLKKTAVNAAFGINIDDATTYPEGSEYYILRHSKDNWTVNYV